MIAAGRAAPRRSLPLRTLVLVVVAAALVGTAGGVLLHRLRASAAPAAPSLPELHGQAVWAAGVRPAPAFALRDQRGVLVSLGALRGRPVLLTFLDSQCHSACPIAGRQLASVLRRLPAATRPTLVVVSVDPKGDTRAGIERAMHAWGLAGPWRWHWLNATRTRLASVWRSYGIAVQPTSNDIKHGLTLYLIDRRGYERTAYLFPFLPAFVQGDLARLARERT